ncbi:MAG: glycosyltransferase family 2 protein [Burkholderiales bacterium]
MKNFGNTTNTRPASLSDYPARHEEWTSNGGRRSHRSTGRESAAAPAVTVVTVVRNGSATLMRAAESVLSQDYPGIEYVVIDGQSTDDTVPILCSLGERVALWVSEPDAGISDAFNKGISLARGQIVGLLNCDDWYEPGAVQAAVEALECADADIVCGEVQYWEGDQKTYLVSSDPELLDRGMTVAHPTVFVRRRYYEQCGLFRLDFKLAMDYEWLLRAKLSGARMRVLERCLANMSGGGIGDRRWRESQCEVARARALHVPGANTMSAYYFYVWRSTVKGVVRRYLDLLGLGILRRWYHRWCSQVSVTSTQERR